MSNPWTPGPWVAGFRPWLGWNVSAAGIAVAATAFRSAADDGEEAANARLIAAAPEMAEALHNLISLAEPHFSDETQMLALNIARALLARIRGDAP